MTDFNPQAPPRSSKAKGVPFVVVLLGVVVALGIAGYALWKSGAFS
ncbi:MAG: hypothetical protein JWO84_54 [Parcubacteria group bacterium]|nr:hypothetical protein [Parcubacteria group bacterium]